MSNYANFFITDRTQVKKWISYNLGWPLMAVELIEDQMEFNINDALEMYTKFVIPDERYRLTAFSEFSADGSIIMPDDVAGIFNLEEPAYNTLGQTMGSMYGMTIAAGGAGNIGYTGGYAGGPAASGNWITYELAMQHLDLVKHLTGAKMEFNYNPRTKVLGILPNPYNYANKEKMGMVIGCRVIRPEDQLVGEDWVKRYALALCKIMVGNHRSKYTGVTLPGGGTVNTDIKQEGITERDALIQELTTERSEGTSMYFG